MHMLHEMLAFATCLTCFLHVPVAMPSTRGNPVVESTPPSLACSTHPHTSFSTGIFMSYRNQYVAVAPFSLSPPWHPFCSAMVTKCFITCSCQHFLKKMHKLPYVIRIMITSIKMFKIIACFKLLSNIWGFSGIVICCFRPHLNLPK